MYGVKESGVINFEELVKKLALFSYHPMKFTPELCKHKTCRITFTLCVDELGVKFFSKADAVHLVNSVKSNYKFTVDWESTL